jgi:hypothetical protein
MDFLPDNYEAPQGGGGYMKFQKGDNKFRIVAKPIIGWLDWKDKKPYRFKYNEKPEKPMSDQTIKHFWAMLVWNYDEQSVQILEITQATIQKSISDLAKNEDWGAPYNYDLKVNRKGESLATEYSVMPSPKKALPEEVLKAIEEKPCDLEALFFGADPWTPNGKKTEIMVSDLPF